jgi:hypothetical protein
MALSKPTTVKTIKRELSVRSDTFIRFECLLQEVIDDIVPEPVPMNEPKDSSNINKRSTTMEKIELFLTLFAGRDDVYAERFENNQTGFAGYAPVCRKRFENICPKKNDRKMKCTKCPLQNFTRYGANAIERHLLGEKTVGAYPMFPDETCRFLAFDFDGKNYTPEELRRDVTIIREACKEKNICMAVERSRSGNGIHFWIFFEENIPTGTARKFGSSLITYAMGVNHKLPFKTYDRMIPSQDTLTKDGLGNLIALPLQKKPRADGNSVFLDNDFNACADQWEFLHGVKKYTLKDIESFIRQLSPSGDLGELRLDSEDEKPWEGKKTKQSLSPFNFPDKVKIVQAICCISKRRVW